MKSVIFGLTVVVSLYICGVSGADWEYWVAAILIVVARALTMESQND